MESARLPLELSLRRHINVSSAGRDWLGIRQQLRPRVRVGVKPSEENLDSESDKALMDEKDARV